MNKCRECWKSIPDRFNWWQALWCSSCRFYKDNELEEIRKEKSELEISNEQRGLMYRRNNEDFEKLRSEYWILWNQYALTINDNERLEKQNEKLIKWTERLFEQIEQLKKELEAIKLVVNLNDSVVEKVFDLSIYEDTHEKAIQYLEENYVVSDDDLIQKITREKVLDEEQ